MTLVDECFPRGGKPKIQQAQGGKPRGVVPKKKNDALFKDTTVLKKKRLKKKKTTARKDPTAERLPKKTKKSVEKDKTALLSIEPLNFKMLVEGMNVLGQVLEVRDMDLTLSLPGRLMATVPITNISTPYSGLLSRLARDEDVDVKSLRELFHAGQVVPCCVRQLVDDTSKIVASLNPLDLNRNLPVAALAKGLTLAAAVRSVEDHGYVMDVGLADVRCFLPRPEGSEAADELTVGEIVQANVVQCQVDGAVATLHLSLSQQFKIKQNVELNVATLTPGTRVHVNVKKVSPQGLQVSFGNLIGYVHKDHLVDWSDSLTAYSNQSKPLTAVVLYAVPLVSAVYLSLKSTLTEPQTQVESQRAYAIGRLLDGAAVAEASNGGVVLRLDAEGRRGFVPLRHLSDALDQVEDVRAHHPVGAQRRCRVIQHAALDQVYICTMKKSLMNQKALRYEDFTVGELVEGRIESVAPSGITVSLGQNLKGFVPKLHWADDPRLRRPELRFKTGASLVCRVLRLRLDRRQLHLTCKPSLVDDADAAVVSDVGQLQRRARLKGVVSLIQPGGVLVAFYGELTGWMPRQALRHRGVADVDRFFFPGQVVNCVVDAVDEETGKVTLNLAKSTESTAPVVTPASIVRARVLKVQPVASETDGPAGVEVELTTAAGGRAWIPAQHLTDFPTLASFAVSRYRPGDVIDQVLLCAASKLQTIGSLRPSLIEYVRDADRLPATLADVQVNATYPCLYSRKRDCGYFAELLLAEPPGRCTVLVPRSKAAEPLRALIDAGAGGAPTLVVHAKVLSVDADTAKVAVSALPTDLDSRPAAILTAYLKEVEEVRQRYLAGEDAALRHLAGLKPGDAAVGRTASAHPDAGADVDVRLEPHGLRAVVPAFHRGRQPLKADELVAGCILHVDLLEGLVYVTTRDKIVEELTEAAAADDAAERAKIKAGAPVPAKVLVNTPLLSVVLAAGRLWNAPNARNWNEAAAPAAAPYAVGAACHVLPQADGVVAPYLRHGTPDYRKRQRKTSTASTQSATSARPSKKTKTSSVSEEPAQPAAAAPPTQLARLQVAAAFNWDDEAALKPAPTAVDSSDDDDEEPVAEQQGGEKLTAAERRDKGRQRRAEAAAEERALAALEAGLVDGARAAPQSADDFDRLLLASPNSSILWLQYMAMHLEQAEVDKARATAQRALQQIGFREEQEKFNVWIAWLNLEHMYGTTEAYDNVFQEALRCNDPLKVYRQMALNLERAQQADAAEAMHQTILKKFGKQDRQVWLAACSFHARASKMEAARAVFQKALTVLPKKEHVELISRFGQLEVKLGELERGKTMFETLMASYPKRTDLWLVYVDTLAKGGHIESARQVLERCTTLQLPAKKMKSIFQKYLLFETAHGDEERLDAVRRKALDYVESKTSAAADDDA